MLTFLEYGKVVVICGNQMSYKYILISRASAKTRRCHGDVFMVWLCERTPVV
jgi:hypothetical protein